MNPDHLRKSSIEIGRIYFWTAIINKWQHLLRTDSFKDVIISSLQYLHTKNLIDVFGFVIMPNHIHLIWRINNMNGKESPASSLLKFSAHQFKKMLSSHELSNYKVTRDNKSYEFWQRDSLAIHLYSPEVMYQKLEYIHGNPTTERWSLVKDTCDYVYSSASFYEKGSKRFTFLKHIGEEV
ncbi:MAG: transposase [Cyclobacteriaceae bacterium]